MALFPLISLLFPIQGSVVIDDARRDAGLLDKQVGRDLGYSHESDWSKAKHGVRPLDFHRLVRGPKALQWAILRRWEAALLADEKPDTPPAGYPDCDLLDDIAAKLRQLRRRMAKADLPSVDSQKRSA